MLELMLTATQVADEVMLQAFVAVTQTFPPPVPLVTTMLSVPCPEVIVHPVGTVQLYDMAPGTLAAE
jgi:hypothetical protein